MEKKSIHVLSLPLFMQICFHLASSQTPLYHNIRNLDNGTRCTETSVFITHISCFNNHINNNKLYLRRVQYKNLNLQTNDLKKGKHLVLELNANLIFLLISVLSGNNAIIILQNGKEEKNNY